MIASLYRRHSLTLLLFCAVLLPILVWYGDGISSNNGVDAWMPSGTPIRKQYDEFVRAFGADETILIAFQKPFPDAARLQSISKRLAGLDGVRACWTRSQVAELMLANGVDSSTADERLINLLKTPSDDLETLMLSLTNESGAPRTRLLTEIRYQLDYCGLSDAIVAGGPVVTAQLDLLGGKDSGRTLFQITLLICAVLLYLNIGCWKTSALLLVMNVFSIQCTLSIMRLLGQKMNFILGSLPVLVMVFTTSAAVHLIGQYIIHSHQKNGLSLAMRAVLWPSLFAMITTLIGLLSLDLSDIGPITDFGNAAAVGTVVSFLVGIGLTPAILTVVRYQSPESGIPGQRLMETAAMVVLNRPVAVLLPLLLVTVVGSSGLYFLQTLIDPLEFLPGGDRVLRDTLHVKSHLTSPTSIEAVIDFAGKDSSFVGRLKAVQKFESVVSQNQNVRHVLSLADFFPADLQNNELSVSSLMSAAGSSASGALLADGCRLWRVSMRLNDDSPSALRKTLDELKELNQEHTVIYTGLGPLLEYSQGNIFLGFWRSFSSALVIMTVVMMVALRSPVFGIAAMVPNLQPIALIFGCLGWLSYPVDIGVMMTASIALGLTVDGTFHFLCIYQEGLRRTMCRYRAVRYALLHTGMPMLSSGLISGIGLLALACSPFRPAMRFGILMFLLMTAATISGLVIFPACLSLGAKRRRIAAKCVVTTLPAASRAA
jgi:predicted RND superfamily exporter protein